MIILIICICVYACIYDTVKGNTAVAHVTMNNVTAIMAQAPARGKRPRADCNA